MKNPHLTIRALTVGLIAGFIALLHLIVRTLADQQLTSTPLTLFPGVSLQLAHNHAMAWGITFGGIELATAFSLLAIIILTWVFIRYGRTTWQSYTAFGCIYGGALANLYERITTGYVVDYVHILTLPNFNIADAALTVGALFLLISYQRILSA